MAINHNFSFLFNRWLMMFDNGGLTEAIYKTFAVISRLSTASQTTCAKLKTPKHVQLSIAESDILKISLFIKKNPFGFYILLIPQPLEKQLMVKELFNHFSQ